MKFHFYKLLFLFIPLIACLSCVSFQYGNPSLTIFRNHGDLGIYGKTVSMKNQFRQGESCIQSYFGLVSFGDASTEIAQNKAHITEVLSIDHSIKTQYFFLQEYCTVVHGK